MNGSEGPQIADKALDRAIWFNTDIDQETGETRMFMYSGENEKYYVLKEVETGVTPARDTNAISQRQTATGGFVAMEADSPSAGTPVRLYEYTIEPSEIIPPQLTSGDATRTSAAAATVTFTSYENGAYYYAVVVSSADVPAIDTNGAGTQLIAD